MNFMKKVIDWDDILSALVANSIERQSDLKGEPSQLVLVNTGLVGISFGAKSGATEAAMKLANRTGWISIGYAWSGQGTIPMSNLLRCSLDVKEKLIGRKIDGIVIMSDSLQEYTRRQFIQAVMNAITIANNSAHNTIIPMVMVG